MEVKLRCQALDSNEKRCKNIARHVEHYHGDHEIYGYNFDNPQKDMTWVEIGVCNKHQKTHSESENYNGKVYLCNFLIKKTSFSKVVRGKDSASIIRRKGRRGRDMKESRTEDKNASN